MLYRNRIDYNRQLQTPFSRNFNQNYQRFLPQVNRSIIKQQQNFPDEEWKHYQAHRDRRDLYERILAASPL